MTIRREDVVHVARLARLDLTDDEIALFTGQLGVILEHASLVDALDTEGVEPTAHPVPLANVLRDDVPHQSLPRAVVLAQAPDVEGAYFRVPVILDAREEPE